MKNRNCGRKIEVPGKLPIKPKKRQKECKPEPEHCPEEPKVCDSTCQCNAKAPGPKPAKLTNDCVVVNSLVGSKNRTKSRRSDIATHCFW